eukprot:gene8289-113_t
MNTRQIDSFDGKRVCFISASYLYNYYQKVPKDIMENSILFFGSKRFWFFPKNEKEKKESLQQPTQYLAMKKEFLDLILEKEKKGLCYYLKPDKLGVQHDYGDYKKVSKFFEDIDDLNGKKYSPLILDDEWWKTKFDKNKMGYFVSASSVIANYHSGDHSYSPTMALVEMSNPNIIAVLTSLWK